ncbi:glycosyltransferase family 2 protein [Alistipes communis]|uniref:glycosyltransferase family 2 protein n=1 Tax=Alistipes communis TaxID=2585118 RepID=UPI003AF9EFB9
MSVVKIVILNWNGAAHLRRFLPSVVRTAPPGVEIVVADNGSTDGSAALVEREFPSVTLLQLPENYGFAGGYNRALEQLGGNYWVLLNSDVEPAEGWLEPLIAELDAQPDVAAVGPKLLSCAERDRFEYAGAAGGFIDWFGFPFCRGRILRTLERDRGQYDDARDVFWVSGAAFCCRAEAFRRTGGFDAGFFAHMEEIDLCWRMQLAGWRVRVVPRSRVWHLGGGTLQNDSPRKLYLNYRNNLAMLFKCASPVQRVAVAVLRPLADAAAALVYLLKGQCAQAGAVACAYRDFLTRHGELARQRRAVQQSKRRRAAHIYHGSIILRYLLGRRVFGERMQGL